MAFSNRDITRETRESYEELNLPAPEIIIKDLPEEQRYEVILDAMIRYAGDDLTLILSRVGADYQDFKEVAQDPNFVDDINDRVRREVVMPALPDITMKMIEKARSGDDRALDKFLKASKLVENNVQVNQQYNFSDMSTSQMLARVESLKRQLLSGGDIIDEREEENDGFHDNGGDDGGASPDQDLADDVHQG